MDTQRLILLFIFGFSVLMLWEAWQREHRPTPPATVQQPSVPASPTTPKAGAPAAPRAPGAGIDSLQVRLRAQGKDGLQVEKVYTFRRNDYVIDVQIRVQNRGSAPLASYAYFQLTHDGKPEGNRNSVAETFGAQSFTGFAVYSQEHKYQKVP